MSLERSGYRDSSYNSSQPAKSTTSPQISPSDPEIRMASPTPSGGAAKRKPGAVSNSHTMANVLDDHDGGRKEERLSVEEEAIRSQFTAQEIRDLKMVFDTFDGEKTGCIDVVNVRRALIVLGFKLSMRTVTRMIEDLDDGRSGSVTFSEFLEIIILRQGDARDPYDELIQGFQMMDTGKKGKLTYMDLKRAAKQAGVKFTDRELWEMIEEADLNGDRMVNQEEFIKVMLQTNLF